MDHVTREPAGAGPPGGVEYRRARPGEASAVADLVERSYAHYVPAIGMRPGPMNADYDRALAHQTVWVAERQRIVVGVLVLDIEADHVLVDNVAVSPDAQGLGIGSRLLEIAEDEARAAGVGELRLFTHVMMTGNIALYGRRGYVETHRVTERGFARAFFTKQLPRSSPSG